MVKRQSSRLLITALPQISTPSLSSQQSSRRRAGYGGRFAGAEDEILPAVLLGVDEGVNLFLDETWRLSGRYVPAFLRRYLFVFAQNDAGTS